MASEPRLEVRKHEALTLNLVTRYSSIDVPAAKATQASKFGMS